MSEIGAVLGIVVAAAVPVTFIARCLAAVFSEESRFQMKDKPGVHLAWSILSALAVAYFVAGGILTHRKASDHQERTADHWHYHARSPDRIHSGKGLIEHSYSAC